MKRLEIKTLDKGYANPCEVLLHSSFQILVDFMEKESPGEIVNWKCSKIYRSAWKELNSLYNWWKKERPARQTFVDQLPKNKKPKDPLTGLSREDLYPEWHEALIKDYHQDRDHIKEDNQNLLRLCKIRGFLWV